VEHNRRFRKVAAQAEDYHGRRPTRRELHEIFRLETERTVSNDWVIRHQGRCWQLQPRQRRYGPTKSKALVCEWEDGTVEVHYRGERITFAELKEAKQKAAEPSLPVVRTLALRRPDKDHPWRQPLSNHEAVAGKPDPRRAARGNASLRFALTAGLRFRAHSHE
jgi:hypothetical protein